MTYIEVLTQAATKGYRSVQIGGRQDVVSLYEQELKPPPMEWALLTEEIVLNPERIPGEGLAFDKQGDRPRIVGAEAVQVASVSMLHPRFLGTRNDLHTDRERLTHLITQSGVRPADLPSLHDTDLRALDLTPQLADEIQRATVTALRRAASLMEELPELAALVGEG